MSPQSLLGRQRGLTLVELMVSVTIGMFLLIGLAALIGSQSGTRRSVDNTGKLIENGRYALEMLARDIQLAGFYGQLTDIPTAPGTLPDPCSVVLADIVAALPVHIQGYNAPSGVAVPSCVVNHKAGTDIVVVRRADTSTAPIAVASAVNGMVYLQTGLNASKTAFEYRMATGASADFTLINFDGTVAPLRRYLTHIYFVSECSAPTGAGGACAVGDDGGTWVPTLKRLELSAAAGATQIAAAQSLVEGVDSLQFDFGLDTVPPTAAADADGSADGYTAGTYQDAAAGTPVAMTATDWANVVAVRVHVLSRSVEFENGHTDTKTYSMGLSPTAAATNDAFKRHVFTQLVRVVNPSARKSAL